MKRKAPETLLEFSDYLHPANKKFKFTPEPLEPLAVASHQLYDCSYESDFHSSPASSPSYQNSGESDSLEEVANTPPVQRRRSNSVSSSEDFDIEEFLAHDPLADKPSNSRKPLKSLVQAIKWITENKRILQKEISDALGVSPSTMSLYMNNTPRQHGWKQLERKLVDWMRSVFNAKQHLTPRSLPAQAAPLQPELSYNVWNQEPDYSSYYNDRVSYQPYYYPQNIFPLDLQM